jgi:hypothetical protein
MNKMEITLVNGLTQTLVLTPCTFKSGSKGFRVTGKMDTGDGRLQIGANLVLIGSNPNK